MYILSRSFNLYTRKGRDKDESASDIIFKCKNKNRISGEETCKQFKTMKIISFSVFLIFFCHIVCHCSEIPVQKYL